VPKRKEKESKEKKRKEKEIKSVILLFTHNDGNDIACSK
jgi:hypothetical protein